MLSSPSGEEYDIPVSEITTALHEANAISLAMSKIPNSDRLIVYGATRLKSINRDVIGSTNSTIQSVLLNKHIKLIN